MSQTIHITYDRAQLSELLVYSPDLHPTPDKISWIPIGRSRETPFHILYV
jgi:hypothetical protein